jgi:acyl-CoA thioester hydrolase
MSTTFVWPVRVYYEDTDTAGVVYYANYLKFMERARTEWLRSFGFEQDVLIRDEKLVFAVRSIAVDYRRPALFNDALEVTASIKQFGKASIDFEQSVIRNTQDQEELLASGKIKLACLDSESLRPKPLPSPIAEVLLSVR